MNSTVVYCGKPSAAIQRRKELISKLNENGTLFVICSTEYDQDSNVKFDFFDVIKSFVDEKLHYVNTIVYPTKKIQKVSFNDNVRYVTWFVKNEKNYSFNKDTIREKHIWEKVEWGRRTKNYNKKGKDPGNVWIPTLDDGNAHITKHILFNDEQIIRRLIDMSCSNTSNCVIIDDYDLKNIDIDFNRKNSSSSYSVKGDVYFSSSENMKDLQSKTVSCVITSPPYWNLKNYFKDGQIGQEEYNKYVLRMKKVWSECYKKLVVDGTIWINVNVRVNKGNVILIPYDIIRTCKEIGLHYKGIVIWHKSSGIPAKPNNVSDHHEYILLFTKSKKFAIQSKNKNINDYKNDDINNGAFWNINRKAGSIGKKYIHPAIYPNKLVERIITLSTYENELILDPFVGSGTTIIASILNNRSCVGYELYEGFYELMQDRFFSELPNSIKISFHKK